MNELHLKEILEESGMVKAWNTFTAVSSKVLELDFSAYYFCNPNFSLVDRVMQDIISYQTEEEHHAGFLKRFFIKTRRLFATKWMFDFDLLPDNFWYNVVWISISDHIRRPIYV
jgi:hypothetical protein